MNNNYDPDNGKIDNMEEFLNESSFDDEPQKEETPTQLFTMEDVEQMVHEMIREERQLMLDQMCVELKKITTFHMESWVQGDYLGNKAMANALNEVIKGISRTITHAERRSPDQVSDIEAEYRVVQRQMDRKEEEQRKKWEKD